MEVLGITGGVGSGKSEVLNCLEKEYGACICQMDEVSKRLQKKGEVCFQKIVDYFGESVVGRDGELNREELGRIVFSDGKKLKILNGIVHPEVIEYVKHDIERKNEEGQSLYVVESALLTEVGNELCDRIFYIYADEAVRRERLEKTRGYTQDKITLMISSQPKCEEFRKMCTDVIDNSGSFEDTKRQIGEKI